MSRQITALFETHDEAAAAIRLLQEHQFNDREYSVVARPDDVAEQDDLAARVTSMDQLSGRGGAWGGSALGTALGGALAELNITLVRDLPLLVVGGHAMARGEAGVFESAATDSEERERLERTLRAGGVLIGVRAKSDERAQLAAELLQRA